MTFHLPVLHFRLAEIREMYPATVDDVKSIVKHITINCQQYTLNKNAT